MTLRPVDETKSRPRKGPPDRIVGRREISAARREAPVRTLNDTRGPRQQYSDWGRRWDVFERRLPYRESLYACAKHLPRSWKGSKLQTGTIRTWDNQTADPMLQHCRKSGASWSTW